MQYLIKSSSRIFQEHDDMAKSTLKELNFIFALYVSFGGALYVSFVGL